MKKKEGDTHNRSVFVGATCVVWRANQHYPGTIVPGLAGFRKQAEPNDSTSHSWYVCTTGTFVPYANTQIQYHDATIQTNSNKPTPPTNQHCSRTLYHPFTIPPLLLLVYLLTTGVTEAFKGVIGCLQVFYQRYKLPFGALASCWCLLFSHLWRSREELVVSVYRNLESGILGIPWFESLLQ